MPVLSNPAFGLRTALGYVTGGTLLCVWTLVWYFTRDYDQVLSRTQWFWIAGLFFSGVTFIFLGLLLGPLGRAARQAELPPGDALRAEALIQQLAAAHLPAAPPPAPAAPPPAAQPAYASPAR
jgi:uncharacterized membrane protein YdcZ (DUF606 family)